MPCGLIGGTALLSRAALPGDPLLPVGLFEEGTAGSTGHPIFEALAQNTPKTTARVFFMTKFARFQPSLNVALRKHWLEVESNPTLSGPFKSPPMLSNKRHPNLHRRLTRALINNPSINLHCHRLSILSHNSPILDCRTLSADALLALSVLRSRAILLFDPMPPTHSFLWIHLRLVVRWGWSTASTVFHAASNTWVKPVAQCVFASLIIATTSFRSLVSCTCSMFIVARLLTWTSP